MDIKNLSNWEIMQLPRSCFGYHWLITVGATMAAAGTDYDISESALPERCVIWGMSFWGTGAGYQDIRISLALGDQLPANDAQFDALDVLSNDLGFRVAGRRVVTINAPGQDVSLTLFQPIVAMGRRIVGRFEWMGAGLCIANAVLEISAYPTEIPKWANLGLG